MVYPDGTQHRFDNDTSRLMEIVTPAGQSTTLAYDTATGQRLESVTGPYGHQLTFQYDATTGLLDTVTDPATNLIDIDHELVPGSTTAYRLTEVTYPDQTTRTYHYEDATHLTFVTGMTDENGERITTYSYHPDGKAASTERSGGVERTTFEYEDVDDGQGGLQRKTTVTDARGEARVYFFRENNGRYLPESVAKAGDTKRRDYDARGRRTQVIDERSIVTESEWDEFHRTAVTEAFGTPLARTTEYDYLADEHALATTLSRPSVSAVATDRFTTAIDYAGTLLPHTMTLSGHRPDGTAVTRTTTHTYYTPANSQYLDGLLHQMDGPRPGALDVTTYTYYDCHTGAECGQLKTVTDAAGHVTFYNAYDAHGRLTERVTPNDLITLTEYDLRGRVTNVRHQSGAGAPERVTNYTYEPNGNLAHVSDADGVEVSYDYNAALQLTQVVDDLGQSMTYDYDLNGNRTVEQSMATDGVTVKRHREQRYDTRDRLEYVDQGGDATTAFGITQNHYDPAGNLTAVTDPNHRVTDYRYDVLERLDQQLEPLVQGARPETLYGYDVHDRLTSVRDARLNTTTYVYDDLGNQLSEDSPDAGLMTYTHDDAGNVKTRTDARGVVTTYDYDGLNRLTNVAYSSHPSENVTYTYDDPLVAHSAGRLTRVSNDGATLDYEYDAQGHVTQVTQTVDQVTHAVTYTYTYTYTYTDANRPQTITYPSGRIVSYGYDDAGQVQTVLATVDGQVVALGHTGVYLPFGDLAFMQRGNQIPQLRTYDLDYRLNLNLSTGALRQLVTWDPASNVNALFDLDDTDRTQLFGYDDLDRLTFAASNSDAQRVYGYDELGNRELELVDSAPVITVNDPNSNQIATVSTHPHPYVFDAAGYLTTGGAHGGVFTYNDAGRLSHASVPALDTETDYRYNALGQRTQKAVTSGNPSVTTTTRFVYNLAGQLIAETDEAGVVQREYIYLNGEPFARIDPGTPSSVYYFHTDQLGTPRVMTDDTGQVVWQSTMEPFGTVTVTPSSTVDNPLRFPGQYVDDETGLHYNYHRYYDPSTGRYLRSDPIGLNGGINTYAYAAGNPLRNIDPFGLNCITRDGRFTCALPNGPAFTIPAPMKAPSKIGPRQRDYHYYRVSEDLRGADPECVFRKLVEAPTPSSNPMPALPDGQRNNAPALFWDVNIVTSYLTRDASSGMPIVVNAAGRNDGSAFGPGYVARWVENGKVYTGGEGLDWWQSPNAFGQKSQDFGNWYIWNRDLQRKIDECLCQ